MVIADYLSWLDDDDVDDQRWIALVGGVGVGVDILLDLLFPSTLPSGHNRASPSWLVLQTVGVL